MLLAPLLLLVGFVVHPPEPYNGAQMLEVLANDAARWNVAHILFTLSMVLSIPATLGLMDLLERRGGARFGLIGGALVLVGVVFLTLYIGIDLAISAIASIPVEQHARMEPAMQALIDFNGPLPVVFVGLNLGLFVLAAGLIPTRVVPRWMSGAIEVEAVVSVG